MAHFDYSCPGIAFFIIMYSISVTNDRYVTFPDFISWERKERKPIGPRQGGKTVYVSRDGLKMLYFGLLMAFAESPL